jgi:hypothetical protein
VVVELGQAVGRYPELVDAGTADAFRRELGQVVGVDFEAQDYQ